MQKEKSCDCGHGNSDHPSVTTWNDPKDFKKGFTYSNRCRCCACEAFAYNHLTTAVARVLKREKKARLKAFKQEWRKNKWQ